MRGYGQCPRLWAVEHLRTHSHYWKCNCSPQAEIKNRPKQQLNNERLTGFEFEDDEIFQSEDHRDEIEDDDKFLYELENVNTTRPTIAQR